MFRKFFSVMLFHKALLGSSFAFLLLTLSACGEDKAGLPFDPTSSSPKYESLRIVATSPQNGASEVSRECRIVVTFSKPIERGSLRPDAFKLGEFQYKFSVDASGRIVTFVPVSQLAPATLYRAIIKSSIQDLNGIAMPSDYSWTFTTE